MKIAFVLWTALLAGCTTVSLEETTKPVTPAATEQVVTSPIKVEPVIAAVQPHKPQSAAPIQKTEVFECRVKWKDGKKHRETAAFKLRVDHTRKTVELGTFVAKPANVTIDAKTIRFTALNKNVTQVGVLERSTGNLETQFVNAKNKARIDGQGSCVKTSSK